MEVENGEEGCLVRFKLHDSGCHGTCILWHINTDIGSNNYTDIKANCDSNINPNINPDDDSNNWGKVVGKTR